MFDTSMRREMGQTNQVSGWIEGRVSVGRADELLVEKCVVFVFCLYAYG